MEKTIPTSSFTAMAFSKGTKATSSDFKYYTGYTKANVVALNPTHKEWNALIGRENKEDDKEFVYTGVNNDGQRTARLDFILKTEETADIPSQFLHLTYRLTEVQGKLSQTGKIQVIDKFGRCAWVTEEQFANSVIPNDKNGNSLHILPPYKKTFKGQEKLIDFLKVFLNIQNPMSYNQDTKEWFYREPSELEACEADLENIKKYFDGDFSELKEIISYQPDNQVTVLVGIREYEGKYYQDVLTDLVLSSFSKKFEKFEEAVETAKNNNQYQSTTFKVQPFAEEKITPTQFEQPATDALGLGEAPKVNW